MNTLSVLPVDGNPDNRLLHIRQVNQELPQAKVTQIVKAPSTAKPVMAGNLDLGMTDNQQGKRSLMGLLRGVRTQVHPSRLSMFTPSGMRLRGREMINASVGSSGKGVFSLTALDIFPPLTEDPGAHHLDETDQRRSFPGERDKRGSEGIDFLAEKMTHPQPSSAQDYDDASTGDRSRCRQTRGQPRSSLPGEDGPPIRISHGDKSRLQITFNQSNRKMTRPKVSRAMRILGQWPSRIRSSTLIEDKLCCSPDVKRVQGATWIRDLASPPFPSRRTTARNINLPFAYDELNLTVDEAIDRGRIIFEPALISKPDVPNRPGGDIYIKVHQRDDGGSGLIVKPTEQGSPKSLGFQQLNPGGVVSTLVNQLKGGKSHHEQSGTGL